MQKDKNIQYVLHRPQGKDNTCGLHQQPATAPTSHVKSSLTRLHMPLGSEHSAAQRRHTRNTEVRFVAQSSRDRMASSRSEGSLWRDKGLWVIDMGTSAFNLCKKVGMLH